VHAGHMGAIFLIVVLVDAEGVDPEVEVGGGGPYGVEGGAEIEGDKNVLGIVAYCLQVMFLTSPDVGKRVIRYYLSMRECGVWKTNNV